ncbi:MAG TPA: hypothetical protein VEG84_03770 [Thermoanaerobaculia bacterium]|nr:hypothetical protein [Thermoanaerobaculia bacterium]
MKKHSLTRRAVARMLLAAPAAALASAPLACQSAQGSRSGSSHLTAAEQKRRQDLARSTARLKKSVEHLDQMEIPVDADPAFRFTPLVGKK